LYSKEDHLDIRNGQLGIIAIDNQFLINRQKQDSYRVDHHTKIIIHGAKGEAAGVGGGARRNGRIKSNDRQKGFFLNLLIGKGRERERERDREREREKRRGFPSWMVFQFNNGRGSKIGKNRRKKIPSKGEQVGKYYPIIRRPK